MICYYSYLIYSFFLILFMDIVYVDLVFVVELLRILVVYVLDFK